MQSTAKERLKRAASFSALFVLLSGCASYDDDWAYLRGELMRGESATDNHMQPDQ